MRTEMRYVCSACCITLTLHAAGQPRAAPPCLPSLPPACRPAMPSHPLLPFSSTPSLLRPPHPPASLSSTAPGRPPPWPPWLPAGSPPAASLARCCHPRQTDPAGFLSPPAAAGGRGRGQQIRWEDGRAPGTAGVGAAGEARQRAAHASSAGLPRRSAPRLCHAVRCLPAMHHVPSSLCPASLQTTTRNPPRSR